MSMWDVTEAETIAEFLRYRNARSGSKYKVTDKPDSNSSKGICTSKACDAIAECEHGSQTLAIEHTKLEVLHNQTYDDVRFLQVAQPIESELNNNDYAQGITVIFEETCFPKGDWKKWSDQIIECLRDCVPRMTDCSSVSFGQPEYPVIFQVQKKLRGPRGAARRTQSKRAQLELVEIMIERIETKLLQLNTVMTQNKRRILLLQMRDLAMVSIHAVPEIFYNEVYPHLEVELKGIAEVWVMLSVPDRTPDGQYKTGCWLASCVYPCRVAEVYEAHFTDSTFDDEWPFKNVED
ncbi:hypothetical protein KBI23_16970 [bacterium]|nr:hypothetical protein [bacterium]MBP9806835.1 hypothetical protein [bacterium]